jgi:hypothetical protein
VEDDVQQVTTCRAAGCLQIVNVYCVVAVLSCSCFLHMNRACTVPPTRSASALQAASTWRHARFLEHSCAPDTRNRGCTRS